MRKRVTLSVITVSIIFGICWITGLLIYVLSHYNILVFGSASYFVSDIMFMFNSCVNPFVYALLNERFRQKIKAMLHCTCKSKRCSPATHEPATIIHQKNQLNTKWKSKQFRGIHHINSAYFEIFLIYSNPTHFPLIRSSVENNRVVFRSVLRCT